MIRPGREAWNRRVKVDGLLVELLDHLYWAGHGASRDRKGRSLRWIGPYYPGPEAGARQATQIAEANQGVLYIPDKQTDIPTVFSLFRQTVEKTR